MPKIYLTQDLQGVIGRTHIYVRLPPGMNSDRWVVRLMTLLLRALLRLLFIKVYSDYIPNLQKLINEFYGDGFDGYVAPDGRLYPKGEKGYWVPQHNHPPFGVCPVCMMLEERYRNGGDPKQMYAEMMSPDHAIIHVDSAVKRPVCYCQIMPHWEANGYGVYGSQDMDSSNQIPPELWKIIISFSQQWFAENTKKAFEGATEQYNQEVQAFLSAQEASR